MERPCSLRGEARHVDDALVLAGEGVERCESRTALAVYTGRQVMEGARG